MDFEIFKDKKHCIAHYFACYLGTTIRCPVYGPQQHNGTYQLE